MMDKSKIIAALDSFKEKVSNGHFEYISIIAIQNRSPHVHGYVGGAANLAGMAKNAMKVSIGQIDKDMKNRASPKRNMNLGADYVCCNLANGYLSFDFLNWLVDAEMFRIRSGAPGPLKVGFWFGKDGKSGLSSLYHVLMFERVIKPALALVGAVEDKKAVRGRSPESFLMKNIVTASHLGQSVPKLQAPEWARDAVADILGGMEPVTITLREASHTDHRNSNLDAWIKFARWLTERGEQVVFVRDTAKADEELPCEFMSIREAAVDLHIRAALYEKAKANMFVSNGPVAIAIYGDKPWLMFHHKATDNDKFLASTPTFWKENQGVPVGTQFPWSLPTQRIIWDTEDSFENIVEAWKNLESNMVR